jgi:antitoxin component YwqK of YwqJK toxin-antitoxin module
MKYIKYLIILLALLNVACSENGVVLTDEQIPDDIFYLKDQIKPYSGKCYIYYSKSKVLKEEMNFKKGILDGEHISYFQNGQIKRKGSYNNGQLNGKWTNYNEDGKLVFEVEYKNDTLIGRFISWYSTGVIKEKGSYLNNRKIGSWIHYDQAGMILAKYSL